MKKLTFILLSIAIFCFFSCGKKWKKPTETSFKFQLNSNSNSGLVKFTSGFLTLNKISFNGDRKQGQNHIELDQSFSSNLQVNLSQSITSSGIKFDIPQGTYSKMEIKMETDGDQTGASLLILGYYVNTINDTIALRFEFPADDAIQIQAKNSSGGNEIVLVEDCPVFPNVILNPNYWFSTVTQSELDSATQNIILGVPTIVINDSDNSDIYELVVDRLKDGNEIVF